MIRIYDPLPDEKEILVLRHFWLHRILLLSSLFLKAFVPLVLFVLGFLLLGYENFFDIIPHFAISMYCLYVASLVILAFIDWYNEELDILIITNKRIIFFIQIHFFKRKSSLASLDQVQEVKGSMNGFLQSTMNFGTLEIQTAGHTSFLTMEEVPNPEYVAEIINQQIEGMRQSQKIQKKVIPALQPNEFLENLLQKTRDKCNKLLS